MSQTANNQTDIDRAPNPSNQTNSQSNPVTSQQTTHFNTNSQSQPPQELKDLRDLHFALHEKVQEVSKKLDDSIRDIFHFLVEILGRANDTNTMVKNLEYALDGSNSLNNSETIKVLKETHESARALVVRIQAAHNFSQSLQFQYAQHYYRPGWRIGIRWLDEFFIPALDATKAVRAWLQEGVKSAEEMESQGGTPTLTSEQKRFCEDFERLCIEYWRPFFDQEESLRQALSSLKTHPCHRRLSGMECDCQQMIEFRDAKFAWEARVRILQRELDAMWWKLQSLCLPAPAIPQTPGQPMEMSPQQPQPQPQRQPSPADGKGQFWRDLNPST
ncbi:uncharacterized protein CTHT_0049310 [Thermochaetoides thermophila DSM 1495]|uniref:Uncharacterized protein n=1 Tax=Chaetomium thermophilum (strain DSM 1495 / CBS 144.50 / IMI 039719) TaxID=759272 RepID=G0SB90_CHATD|nr:hypothetical protein CTHT_0049310 [Thermochaetoides thermophila DSM 1495]EGS19470.1 hypothetical protein CTHT_0049310 [Thermochaetoides thermophila DSM 1495]